MKKIILTALFFGHVIFLFAQKSKDEAPLRNLTKLDLGLQGLGFTFEPRLSDKITIDLSVGAGGGYDIAEDNIDYRWDLFKPAFYFSATPKFYYNRKNRISKGKSTLNNAGNYIGLRLKYVTAGIEHTEYIRNAALINVHWGLQRSLGKHWTFNTHAGVGYARDASSQFGTIYPALDFKFSYILSKYKI